MNEYLTEIYENPAKNSKYAYSTEDFEEVQKNRMAGKLYDQVSDYYRNLINQNKAEIVFSYVEEDGKEYAHVGIYDKIDGEQIL